MEQKTLERSPASALQRWLFPVIFGLWTLRGSVLLFPMEGAAGILQNALDQILNLGIPLLLAVHLVFVNRWTWKQMVFIGICTAVITVSAWRSDSTAFLLVWIFMVCAKDSDMEDIVRVGFWTLLACFVFTVTASLLGLAESYEYFRGTEFRYSLGFSHPNILGMMVQQLVACVVYLRRKKLNLLDLLLCIAAMVFVWVVPNSRASAIMLACLTLLCLVCMVYSKLPKPLRKVVLYALTVAAVGVALFTVIASLTYQDGGTMQIIDWKFNGRLRASNRVYQLFGLSLFGQPLPVFYTDTVVNGQPFHMPWIDSSYLYLLLRYGVLVYLLQTGLYFVGMRNLRKQENVMLLGILAVYALHAAMEPTLHELRKNLFLLAVVMASCGSAADQQGRTVFRHFLRIFRRSQN